ncbi:MAG: diacylglycerol kinase family lipid kinase [Firmicutes bacterium]|nr:diacylglycerol kinase family lipid kinase [Bacillota bacterium]
MKFLLLYNPASGRVNFKSKLPYVTSLFENTDHELTIYESKAPRDLEKTAFKEASAYDVFLVAGGDGTINEVVNGMMKSEIKPIIGVLPSGTANDIAAILGINRSIKRSLKIFFESKPVLIDVNQINQQYFIYTASSGILTRVSYDVSRRHIKKYGYLAYVIAAMQDLALDYRYPIRIVTNGEAIDCECVMVLGLSTNRVGGMRLINFSNAKLNDGLFELRFFKRSKKMWRFRFLSSLIRGGKRLGEDLHLVSDHFFIETDEKVRWNADGEYSCNGSIEIKTYKEAIRVFASDRTIKKYL